MSIAVRGDVQQMLRRLGVVEEVLGAPDPDPFDPQGQIIGRLREAGVEVRPATELVGFVSVDRHVEAELSDERVEKLTSSSSPMWFRAAASVRRVIASGVVQRSDAVATVTEALGALDRLTPVERREAMGP